MATPLFRYGAAVLLALSLSACESDSGSDDSDGDSDSDMSMGTPGVTASPASGETNENGTTATFTVVLNAEPTADVTVTVASGDTGEITVQSGATLTFTSANWGTPQTVTLAGVDDSDVDGTVAVNITATAGSTGGYNGENDVVSVNNADDGKEMYASKDNTLYESSDNPALWSNGAGQYMFAGQTGNMPQTAGVLRRALVAFDISGQVPAGATITSATLTLNVSNARPGANDVSLHRMLRDWGEAGSDAPGSEGGGNSTLANAQTGDSTWSHAVHDGGAAGEWANVAGGQSGADYTAAATTISVNGVGSVSFTGATLVADVQAMLDNRTNYGWMLIGDEGTSQSVKRFDTKENPTQANWPMLILDYTLP